MNALVSVCTAVTFWIQKQGSANSVCHDEECFPEISHSLSAEHMQTLANSGSTLKRGNLRLRGPIATRFCRGLQRRSTYIGGKGLSLMLLSSIYSRDLSLQGKLSTKMLDDSELYALLRNNFYMIFLRQLVSCTCVMHVI